MNTSLKDESLENRPLNLIVAGVGGQGILLTARIIATAAMNQGIWVSIGETFGASRRGGTVLSHIRLSSLKARTTVKQHPLLMGPLVPHNQVDLLIGLEPLEALRAAPYLNPRSVVLLNEYLQPPVKVLADQTQLPTFSAICQRLTQLVARLHTVDALQLAQQAGEIRTANTVMLGALASLQLTPINPAAFETAIAEQFTNDKVRKLNLNAYRLGFQHFRSTN
ncbi:MAG: indolepyruvate oxidoreductase subunit beta [Candidatus Hodarchaeota archaeon]